MIFKILINIFFYTFSQEYEGGGVGGGRVLENTDTSSYEAKNKWQKEYHAFFLSFDLQQHS